VGDGRRMTRRRMTRWREATDATNLDRSVGEKRRCQMTVLESDRARARALHDYLALVGIKLVLRCWYLTCGVDERAVRRW
jgi:hypothetical protein